MYSDDCALGRFVTINGIVVSLTLKVCCIYVSQVPNLLAVVGFAKMVPGPFSLLLIAH